MQVHQEEREAASGTGGGLAPSEASSEGTEVSVRSEYSAGGHSEASSCAGGGHAAGGEVIVPMPFSKDLGTAHLDPPMVRVTLAATQPDQAWTQRVAPGPDGRHSHLCAVWDIASDAQGVQANLRISFPCTLVIGGGYDLPEAQELVGMFAYRLVGGHGGVHIGVARIRELGAANHGSHRSRVRGHGLGQAEWLDLAWLATGVHVGRQQEGGVTSLTSRGGEDAPPAPPAWERKA